VPSVIGRSGDEILGAAAAGQLGALVVGGVELDDYADPAAARAAVQAAAFVVSLELRASAVTELADVVFPVAPVVEKSGSFVSWEGRVRPFPKVITGSNAVADVRVLAGISEELGRPLGFRTPEAAAAELDEFRAWDGVRAGDPEVVPTGSTTRSGSATGYRLATWKTMIGDGPMQDGDPAYHASGPTPVALVSEATLAGLGLAVGEPVQLSTAGGSVVLPLGVADLADDVVWAPTASGGVNLARDLGALPGSTVSLSVVQAVAPSEGLSETQSPHETTSMSANGVRS
jgi:NADH-quinone oxidoreductase subunit G